MSISLVRVDLTPSLHVMSLHRQHGSHPLFVLREFDVKVLRHTAHRKKHDGQEGNDEDEKHSSSSPPRRHRVVCGESQFMATGPSEQALRVSIRAAVLRLGLTMEAATAHEIKLLKEADVLGKRAPSASLLTGPDMCHLLRAFGVHSIATKLSRALETLEPGVMIPCHEDTDVGSHKMRLKNDSHEDDNVVKKLRMKKEKDIRVKLEHSSPNQSKRKLMTQESKHTSSPTVSSPAKRPRSFSHGEIIRSAEHEDISIKDEQAAGCHVFQCPPSSEQFGTSNASSHGALHPQPPLEQSHSTINTSTYIPPTFPQFASTYTTSSHTHPLSQDTFPTTHGHAMEQTRYQTSINNHTLPLSLSHPNSTISSSTPHPHSYEHHTHHLSTSSNPTNHHHHNNLYVGSSQQYQQSYQQQSTSPSFSPQQRQTHLYESIPPSQHNNQQQSIIHPNTTLAARPHTSTLTPPKHAMGFASHPSTSQLIPSSHTISITPAIPSSHAISTIPSSHSISSSTPSTHPTPASNIPPPSHPHNPPPPISTRIQPITIPSHITSRPHIMDSLLPIPSPILLSSPNSKFHLSPNPSKPIQPSISTQHLSSLRAFSAHPFHKRDKNMCIDLSSDLGDLNFPPLCDTQELRIRADVSSLLPIPTPTADTCFSDESSPDMDTEPPMESLDNINIEHELDSTYHHHPMNETDGISAPSWNRKHMNIPRQTSGNCQTESWHTLKHSHHGLNQVIAT